MKNMIIFLLGALVVALLFLVRDLSVAKKNVQAKAIFMTVQQECIARVGEVWTLEYKKPHTPASPASAARLSLALALCKEGELVANRILVRLNKERPKYKDGRVK